MQVDDGARPWGERTRKGDFATDVNVPEGKKGNSVQDQKWLEKQLEAGLIETIDESSDELPFGAMLRWTGDLEDIGAGWQLPPEDRRCTAKSKVRDFEGRYIVGPDNEPINRPCAGWAILGGNVCVKHGGGIERVRAAAQVRLAGAADKLIGELIAIALNRDEDGKTRVNAINSALDRAGVKSGHEVTVVTPGWEKALQEAWDDGERS